MKLQTDMAPWQVNAENWVKEHGRDLEKALFEWHFHQGSKDTVIEALAVYQNDDGGFAHELEPDFRTPESNPIDTWTAVNIMRMIHLDASHEMIHKTLEYLAKTVHNENGLYYFTIPSINRYPHAPWWHYTHEGRIAGYNPTASLLGFIIANTDVSDPFHQESLRVLDSVFKGFYENPSQEMHELRNFVELYHDLPHKNIPKQFCETLEHAILRLVETDPSRWFSEYTCRPSQLALQDTTPGAKALKALRTMEKNMLPLMQNDDGSWEIPWSWGDGSEAWLQAKKAWKSIVCYHYASMA